MCASCFFMSLSFCAKWNTLESEWQTEWKNASLHVEWNQFAALPDRKSNPDKI